MFEGKNKVEYSPTYRNREGTDYFNLECAWAFVSSNI